jgi:hypothetical protein
VLLEGAQQALHTSFVLQLQEGHLVPLLVGGKCTADEEIYGFTYTGFAETLVATSVAVVASVEETCHVCSLGGVDEVDIFFEASAEVSLLAVPGEDGAGHGVGWVVVKLFEVCLLGMWRLYGKMDEKEEGEKILDGLYELREKESKGPTEP